MYNRAAGKGYEAEAFYANTKFVFKVSFSKEIINVFCCVNYGVFMNRDKIQL